MMADTDKPRINSARKGRKKEYQIVKLCEAAGLRARRVPSSGAMGTRGWNMSQHDVIVEDMEGEVKARAGGKGFVQLERWKGSADFLCLWRDHAKPMVVIDFDLFAALVSQAKRANALGPDEQQGDYEAPPAQKPSREFSRAIRNKGFDRTHKRKVNGTTEKRA